VVLLLGAGARSWAQEAIPQEEPTPAAVQEVFRPIERSFVETDGTFTNTERRIQRVHAAFTPVGDSRTDWQAFSDVARRMLAQEGRVAIGPYAGWEYASPAG
jgi:hypothetical protein